MRHRKRQNIRIKNLIKVGKRENIKKERKPERKRKQNIMNEWNKKK